MVIVVAPFVISLFAHPRVSCQALPVRKAMITFNHAGLSFVCRCITSLYINSCCFISLLTEADQPGIALEYANTIDLNT
jgi:hypothetical protein